MVIPDTTYAGTTVGHHVGALSVRTEPNLQRCVIAKPDNCLLTLLTAIATWLLILFLPGCTIPLPSQGKEPQAIHHIILGFGIVTAKAPNDIAYVATSSQALGISVSDGPGIKFGMGYSSNIGVSVSERAEDVRLEISQLPFKPFIIDTQSALLKRLHTISSSHTTIEEAPQ